MDAQTRQATYYPWHRAINRHSEEQQKAGKEWPRFMYDGKTAASEVPRMALVLGMEREGKLPKVFRPCSCCSEGKHIEDNHLTCCLGVKCRECPHLLALEKATELTPEQIDQCKAWTCAAHILANGGDVMGEGFLVTVDDRMFWDRVCESLASGGPDEGPEDGSNK
jgi:hypothetical protein